MDFTAIFLLIIGLGIGFVLGWLLKKSKETEVENINDTEALNQEIAVLKSRIEAAAENYKEQRQKIEDFRLSL